MEDIAKTRYSMEKAIEKYEKTMNLPAVRKALKDAGQDDSKLRTFSISVSDYGVDESFGGKNTIFQRLLNAFMGDGPDRRYAVICPSCRAHNGIIDESEIDKLKYKCPKCKKTVTATTVVQRKVKKVTKPEDIPDLEMPVD